jgi:hypothetical protein
MRVASHWNDYELIDASAGEKLERWGDVNAHIVRILGSVEHA